MAGGRPLVPSTLGAEQREQLQAWSRRAKTAQALAMRSRIVLLAADGLSNTEIARRQDCSLPTAGKWRQRFLDGGLDGLLDEPRPGTPRKLSDRQVEQVLRRTLETSRRRPPTGQPATWPRPPDSARRRSAASGASFRSLLTG